MNKGEIAWALKQIGDACCRNDAANSCQFGWQAAHGNNGVEVQVVLVINAL